MKTDALAVGLSILLRLHLVAGKPASPNRGRLTFDESHVLNSSDPHLNVSGTGEASSSSSRSRSTKTHTMNTNDDTTAYEGKTIAELMHLRPSGLAAKRGGMVKWQEAFDRHPSIVGLDPSQSANEIEMTTRAMRPDTNNAEANRQFSLALKRNFSLRNVPLAHTDLVLQLWNEHCRPIRSRRFQQRQKELASDEKREASNKKERERRQKQYPSGPLRKFVKDLTVKKIIQELVNADISADLSIGEMEAATRLVLDKHSDAIDTRLALVGYLSPKHDKDYVDSVVSLRKGVNLRLSQRRSQARARIKKMNESNEKLKAPVDHVDQSRSEPSTSKQGEQRDADVLGDEEAGRMVGASHEGVQDQMRETVPFSSSTSFYDDWPHFDEVDEWDLAWNSL
ncbi:hypothetical protein CBS101457_003129 [Exobasidium rhododendri]|nr:hypothetical protein CBS101457_003129 [Exobasidium rhododendri]